MSTQKKKFALKITPETLEMVEKNYKEDGSASRSEFIEKAIQFYCGYLTAGDYRVYLPNIIVSTMKGALDSLENRMANMLFKSAVNDSMMMHIIAATHKIDQKSLNALRGICIDDVKRLHGSINLEDAVHYQAE